MQFTPGWNCENCLRNPEKDPENGSEMTLGFRELSAMYGDLYEITLIAEAERKAQKY